ncbi:MAG: sugar ABC transporter permease [Clostridia bacterium]
MMIQRKKACKLAPYLFLLPTLILFAVLLLYPILTVAGYSVFDNVITNKNPVFVGLQHFQIILADQGFWLALGNVTWFTVVSVIFHLGLGIVFALLLNTERINKYIKGFFRAALILPWTFTVTIVAILWRLMLNPSGVINYLLGTTGMDWFGTPATAMNAAIFVNIWCGYPFYMVSVLAGLQGISKDLYEAARIDGATGIASFRYITLPQLKPVLSSLLMLDFIWTMQQFSLIYMTTGGGPARVTDVLGTYTYRLAFSSMRFSRASASALIILFICMLVCVFYVHKQTRSDES